MVTSFFKAYFFFHFKEIKSGSLLNNLESPSPMSYICDIEPVVPKKTIGMLEVYKE